MIDFISRSLSYITNGESYVLWILHIFAIIMAALLIKYYQGEFFSLLLDRLKITRSKGQLDEALIYAMRKPLGYFIWLIGITFAITTLQAHADLEDTFSVWISQVRKLGIIFLFAWFFLRLVDKSKLNLLDNYRKNSSKLNKSTIVSVSKLMKVAVIITAILVTLQSMGVSVSGLVAFGGAGSIVIGFASRDLIANFFGGLMIFLDRPFSEGDWIRSPDKNIEGTVEHIGWRLTRIRTFSQRPLYVPNSLFTTISVENPSRMLNRQIKQVIGIRYKDATKLGVITEEIEKMVKNHPEIDTRRTTFVVFDNFGSSSLDCLIYCFTKTTEWVKYLKIQQEIFLSILNIVRENGADAAFPTTTLDFPEEAISKFAKAD